MSTATTRWISGPVLRARPEGPFVLREAVSVGERGLLGEVIRLREDEIVVQVYEDTTGLRPGTRVTGSGRLLAVALGPGLLGKVFDGLLRPAGESAEPYVEPGYQDAGSQRFPYKPTVRVGDRLGSGAPFATVQPPEGLAQHCLVPPAVSGEVISIAEAGDYFEDRPVLQLRDEKGRMHEVAMRHYWSVRVPRPVAARLPSDEPLLTGQRITDCVFPVARGGKAAIPGGFGTGKTVLLETLAKCAMRMSSSTWAAASGAMRSPGFWRSLLSWRIPAREDCSWNVR